MIKIYTHPVDGVSDGDPSPGERRIRHGLAPCIFPIASPLQLNSRKLRQSLGRLTPPKVVDDESFHAGSLGGIDHFELMADSSGTYHRYDSILPVQGFGESLSCVVDFDPFGGARDFGCRLGMRYRSHLKARFQQSCCDGSSNVPRSLCIVN